MGEGIRRAPAIGLFALAALALALVGSPGAVAAPPASGDWVVTAAESYENQTIVIEGNVFVRSPGVLTLTNVTLEINSTVALRRGIVVEPGATLATRDGDGQGVTSADRTVIRPLSPSERITFVAWDGSTLDLRHTAVWGVGYTQSPINASALYIATNSTVLSNVSVYGSYFGILFAGVSGSFADLSVHNNTYDGLELDAGANLTIRGLSAADNGGAGAHVYASRLTVTGGTFFGNGQGLAVKSGGFASVALFDASNNDIAFLARDNATLELGVGRIASSATAGVDVRLASRANLSLAVFSANPTGVFAAGASLIRVELSNFTGGVHAFDLRTGATLTVNDTTIAAHAGAALDIDTANADFYRCLLEGNAFGGTVVGSTGFGFLDSTLANSTAGGFTFTNSTGIYFHNPRFLWNKGLAVDLAGSSSALLDATTVAEVNRSTVEVDRLSALGSLRLVDGALHAVAARAWTVAGVLVASNASIVGDTLGASLTAAGGWQIKDLRVVDFGLVLTGNVPPASVDGLFHTGAGELALTNANAGLWYNVTQGPGSGRVRAADAVLQLLWGSAARIQADSPSTINLLDFAADLAAAVYGAQGTVTQSWTLAVTVVWAPGVAAPGQSVAVTNGSGGAVASGVTNASGGWSAPRVLAAVGTQAGVQSENPFTVAAGSGSWLGSAGVTVDAPTALTVQLNDAVPPTLTITSPAPGARVRANPVNITGSASDDASGVAEIAWSFDNATFNVGVLADPFTLEVNAPFETTYTVTVRVRDLAGNAALVVLTFRVDRTAPLIVLSSPANGSAVQGPAPRFVGGTEVGALLTINGSAVAVDANGDFDAAVPLPDGNLLVALTALDGAGNAFTLTVSLRVDSTAPAILVEAPPAGIPVASTTTTLSGRVEPGSALWVDAVAQLVAANGSFAVLVDLLVEGQNTFTLRARDGAGNENTVTWAVERDTRAPAISVEGLVGTGPWAFNTTRPSFNITTDEYALITASVSPGSTVDSAAGFQLTFAPALTEGNATLTVRAADAGGNLRQVDFAIRIDLTPPPLILDNRTAGGVVNVDPWTVTVTAEPGATVLVGNTTASEVPAGSGTFRASVDLVPGANALNVVVTDAAGNRISSSFTLALDQAVPPLQIDSPGEGARLTEATATVSGLTEPGASVTVNGASVTVDATGRFSTTVALTQGSNAIRVVSSDPAGNSVEVVRIVTRAGDAPLTGLGILGEYLGLILILLVGAVVAAVLASRSKRRRLRLADKAAAIEREVESARAMRNDLGALENFSPRSVSDPDFVPAEDFRRRQEEAEGKRLASSELEKRQG